MIRNKFVRLIFMALLLLGVGAGVGHAQTVFTVGSRNFAVSVGNFQTAFSPYGTWYYTPTYGYVFIPYGGYTPYSTISAPWYGPTVNYGQWINIGGYGYGWVPSTVYHSRAVIVSRPVRLSAPLRVMQVRGAAPRRL